jgi:Cu/Ag efflux pump CusA
VLWYTLDAKSMDLGEQRALQDWYVKLGLQTVPGVSEVASFGGFEKQYQVTIDPNKLNYYRIPLSQVLKSIKSNNNDVGGRKFEMNGTGYIVRGLGYIKSLPDVENISVGVNNTIPVKIKDVVMRYGENADKVIHAVKAKMADIQKGLPAGVTFKIAYDRSELIENAIGSVKHTLVEEMITVSIIVILFLLSIKSALSIIIQIPITIAASFILLNAFGISSNIMSLTGIALAIGVIVDNGIVMVENSHRNLSVAQEKEKS